MTSKINVYLNFNGNAREAMNYYKDVFGGKLDLSTFKDYHAPDLPQSDEEKIMHGVLETDNGMTIMAADTPPQMKYQGSHGFGLSLSGEDEDELKGYFAKLAEGGQVTMPMAKQVWGDLFGMVTDKFGVNWLVNVNHQE